VTDRVASPDSLLHALESVPFVIGRDGHQSGVFMDSAGWEALPQGVGHATRGVVAQL
jgi:hypothetical protein